MSDVNVLIVAVDKGIDILEGYEKEIEDINAYIAFEMQSIIASIEREIQLIESKLEGLYYEPAGCTEESVENKEKLLRQKMLFEHLLYQSSVRANELELDMRRMCHQTFELADEGKRVMADYIRKLNRISYSSCFTGFSRSPDRSYYYVVIVDSQKYPQTAEHIRMAQSMGFPEYVTLGRTDAADRRRASLANVKARTIYDRDEWPMAAFEEGGQGANVVYVSSHDNRGAGASLGRQMRGFPDGSRVRVRVI